MRHITVLQQEATQQLNLSKGSVVVDCTLGSGGHAEEILKVIGKKGTYIGLDADSTAIEANTHLHSEYDATIHLVHSNFRDIKQTLTELNIDTVDAVLADLGWRMEQFDGSSGEKRGFSFKEDEPLHMTFGTPTDYPFTAHDIVNQWDEEDIANVIYAYGEEHFSRRIAKKIVEVRKDEEITSSVQLADIVYHSVPVPYRRKRTHPATKTFQALRIAVNDEFDALKELLFDGMEVLKPGGRMTIISFHSLEDRIVKQTFKEYARDQKGVLVQKKPIAPTLEEQKENPRARSAKLRTVEKI
ncbi:MAG: 16S rRNA (cytosine1402-N4)-methyltransferase [Acidimicrobiales bacterium]|jgi:16S rRNA (cytosine1402-N4)-methyltransferase